MTIMQPKPPTVSPWSTFSSKTGQPIWVRPLQAADAPVLMEIFEHMGSESRYLRFQQTLDSVSKRRVAEVAESIVRPDGTRKWGLLAFTAEPDAPSIPVGGARYVEVDEVSAEFAISIRDEFQKQGIGKELTHLVIDQAHKAGYRQVVATIQNSNSGMWYIFTSLPYEVTRHASGSVSDVVIHLDKPL